MDVVTQLCVNHTPSDASASRIGVLSTVFGGRRSVERQWGVMGPIVHVQEEDVGPCEISILGMLLSSLSSLPLPLLPPLSLLTRRCFAGRRFFVVSRQPSPPPRRRFRLFGANLATPRASCRSFPSDRAPRPLARRPRRPSRRRPPPPRADDDEDEEATERPLQHPQEALSGPGDVLGNGRVAVAAARTLGADRGAYHDGVATAPSRATTGTRDWGPWM